MRATSQIPSGQKCAGLKTANRPGNSKLDVLVAVDKRLSEEQTRNVQRSGIIAGLEHFGLGRQSILALSPYSSTPLIILTDLHDDADDIRGTAPRSALEIEF